MIFSLFSLLPVLIIVVIVIIVSANKDEFKKGGEDMLRNVYVYLVLFATLMMVIGGSVASFMAFADIFAPAPYHQSFEDFKNWGYKNSYPGDETKTETNLSEAELRDRYDSMVNEQRTGQVLRAKNTLIKSFGWILIPLPIFLLFQRKLKSEAV